MGLKDFFLNGGLFGAMRGFDHEEEGRVYGFGEFQEDAAEVEKIATVVSSVTGVGSLPGGKVDFLEED